MRRLVSCVSFLLLLLFLNSTDIQARPGGDANNDGKVNVADVVFIAHYVYRGGDPPTPFLFGDFDGDLDVDETDIVYGIAYFYRKGDSPATPVVLLYVSATSPHNADGVDSSEVTITATDSQGYPVTGAPLDVLLYIGEDPLEDSLPILSAIDNRDGTYTAFVKSRIAGQGLIAVELVSLNLVSVTPVVFEPGPVQGLTLVYVEQPRDRIPRHTGRIVVAAVDSLQNPVHPPEANVIFETDFGAVDSVIFDGYGDFIGWISSWTPGSGNVYVTEEYSGFGLSQPVELVFPAVHLFSPIRSDTTWIDSTWLTRDITGYLDIGLNVWTPHPHFLSYYDFLISFDSSVVRFVGATDWDGFGPPNVQIVDGGNIRIWREGKGTISNDIARLHFEPVAESGTTAVMINLWNNDPGSLLGEIGWPVYEMEDWWTYSELELYEIVETQKEPKWVSIKLWVAPGADARSLADQIGKAYALFRSHAAKCCPMMYEHILFNYIPDSTWDSLTGDNDSLDTRAERDSARARFDSSGYVDVIGAPDDALPGHGWTGVAVRGDAVIVDADACTTGTTMAHELGHYWGLRGHNDPAGNPWGKDNLMHASPNPTKGTKKCVGLTAAQCSTITANADP